MGKSKRCLRIFCMIKIGRKSSPRWALRDHSGVFSRSALAELQVQTSRGCRRPLLLLLLTWGKLQRTDLDTLALSYRKCAITYVVTLHEINSCGRFILIYFHFLAKINIIPQ